MIQYALQIVRGCEGGWRWVIYSAPPGTLTFADYLTSGEDVRDYQTALETGAVALAKLQGQGNENQRTDPVG